MSLRSPNSSVADPAQPQLEALRGALDLRLAALDVALADPARSGSLQGLILELARAATEEAKAAAARAVASTKLHADVQVAQAHTAAQAAVERERAIAADLRRTLEQLQQRVAAVERERQTDVQAARESFEQERLERRVATGAAERAAAKLREETIDLRRDLEQVRGTLESERARSTELQDGLLRAQDQKAGLDRHAAEANLSLDAKRDELVRTQQMLADLRRAHAQAQNELSAERADANAIRASLQRAEDSTATLIAERESARAEREAARAERAASQASLSDTHQRVTELERSITELEGALKNERTISTELRASLQQAEAAREAAAEQPRVVRTGTDSAVLVAAERRVADLERSLVEVQAKLLAEQASAAALQQAVDGLTQNSSGLVGRLIQDQMTALAEHGATATDLACTRRRVVELQEALTNIESLRNADLQAHQARIADLERAFADTHARLKGEQEETARLRAGAERTKFEISDIEAELPRDARRPAEAPLPA